MFQIQNLRPRLRDSLTKNLAATRPRRRAAGVEGAIDKLDKAMGHGPFTRLVDCIATAKTARSAAVCF